jgi:hypothetical protein
MTLSSVRLYSLLFVVSFSAFSQTTSPSHAIKAIRAAKDSMEYVKGLRELGLPQSMLRKYTSYVHLKEKNLFDKSHFVRAEYFNARIYSDKTPAYVSQVIFSTGDQRLARKVYFVFLHAQRSGRAMLLKTLEFETMLCDWVSNSGVTFRFEKIPGESYNRIMFDIVQVESCGDLVASFNRCDTLSIVQDSPVYTKGKRQKLQERNRFQELDSINAYMERQKKK